MPVASMRQAAPTGGAAPGLHPGLTLDRHRPLALWQIRGSLTIAVVSIAWLRTLPPLTMQALVTRHLDAEEAVRHASLRVPKRRVEWLAGRLAAKHSVRAHCRRHLGEPPATRDVHVGAVAAGPHAGQPFVVAPVGLSVSHSAEFAIAACAPGAVGVDLERERALAPTLTDLLAADDLGASEPSSVSRLDAMGPALRWACKEAVLKLSGVGLRVDTREVRLVDWHRDGRFSWRAGSELIRRMPVAADSSAFTAWAHVIDGYALAIVWN